MLKKTITYTDYNDVERVENFYFNLTKAEIVEMDASVTGGMQQLLEKIIAEKDMRQLMEHFKRIILTSYGEKSPDGKRFIKSKELSEAFSQTEAYSELFIELMSNGEDNMSNFVNSIMPQDLVEQQ